MMIEGLEQQIVEGLVDKQVFCWRLPSVWGDEKLFIPQAYECFDLKLARANIGLLRCVTADVNPMDIGDRRKRRAFGNNRQMLLALGEMLELVWLNNLTARVRPVEETLSEEIPGILRWWRKGEAVNLSSLEARLGGEMQVMSDNVVTVAPSHMTLRATVTAAGSGKKELGLLVADEHVDIYGGVRRRGGEGITKGNVLAGLLTKDDVGMVSVVGISGWTERVLMGTDGWLGMSWTNQATSETRKFYQKVRKRLGVVVYPQNGLGMGKDGKDGYLEQIREQVRLMKKNGVKRLLFSVDVDVLDPREGYISCEYNPVAMVFNLGMQDLGFVEANGLLMAKFRDLNEYQRKTRAEALAEVLLTALYQTGYTRNRLLGKIDEAAQVKGKFPGGLSLELLLQTILVAREEALAVGLELGVVLGGGGVWLGDVTEVVGIDIVDDDGRGRMAKAVRQIVDCLSE